MTALAGDRVNGCLADLGNVVLEQGKNRWIASRLKIVAKMIDYPDAGQAHLGAPMLQSAEQRVYGLCRHIHDESIVFIHGLFQGFVGAKPLG